MTHFGTTADGRYVERITLEAGDLKVAILTLGAALHEVRLAGVDYNLTAGTDDVLAYAGDWRYHGTIIGPIANRISTAQVKIEGMMHELERNQDGRIHLHSGKDATHFQVWSVVEQSASSVTLETILGDGLCGLPGKRTIRAVYTVTAPATLTLSLTGTSDADTMMNLAQHGYWNMDGSEDWTGHRMHIAANHYLPTDADACPTGETAEVSDSLMDLRDGPEIASRTHIFDHNFCTATTKQDLRDVVTLTGTRGVKMTMATTETGIQIYDGRRLPMPYSALAIEAQGWPDAPNHRGFPSIRLKAGETYAQTTSWRFET
ncbi:MAG: aldose epimerase family protein [Yoonia sp.]|jgi:aldose 1-epimerase|nr:galactose mutarotase [Loktanella sp.]MDO7627446.1 galactose mutarotase [Loktanella sp.]MDO7666443.1 galactose mutarotase [Loktanella sp.]MDO7706270.1 galactose mutarotase [Loktanella sp.]MDO7725279.1 galactose mutarotase [Loktanella sp.]